MKKIDSKVVKTLLKSSAEINSAIDRVEEAEGKREKWYSLYKQAKADLQLARRKAEIDAKTIKDLRAVKEPQKSKLAKILFYWAFFFEGIAKKI